MPTNTSYIMLNNTDCHYCDYIIKYLQCQSLWKMFMTCKGNTHTNLNFQNLCIIVCLFMLLKRSAKNRASIPCIKHEHCRTGAKKNIRARVWGGVLGNTDFWTGHSYYTHHLTKALFTWTRPVQNQANLTERVKVSLEPKPNWRDISSWWLWRGFDWLADPSPLDNHTPLQIWKALHKLSGL